MKPENVFLLISVIMALVLGFFAYDVDSKNDKMNKEHLENLKQLNETFDFREFCFKGQMIEINDKKFVCNKQQINGEKK